MSSPLIPWETCNFPEEVQKELIRRKKNISFNFQKTDGWDSNGGDWQKYKGPMTSWVRVCSNGLGRPGLNKPGFVLTPAKSFYQTYGFQPTSEGNQQILGFTPSGKPHIIINDKNNSDYPINVPSPEVTRVETIIQKELFRRAWIHWTCFSKAQLEYMTPYFLVPRISVILEFGWNHFNPDSLIDLNNEEKLVDYYFNNPYPLYNENVLKSNGNYDVVFGIITNFEWSVEGNKINCLTEITSLQKLYAGVPISSIVTNIKTRNEDTPPDYLANIKKICESDFIKNLRAISTLKDLSQGQADENLSQQQLFRYIADGPTPMKDEYWRGVFYGRTEENIQMSKNNLDYDWDKGNKSDDFDKGCNSPATWVNMGFIVELLNRCFAASKPKSNSNQKDENFFEVNVDEAVIGAHPNHISTNGEILLIPNAFSPKYFYGDLGKQQNIEGNETKDKSLYLNQFISSFDTRKINKKKKDLSDPLWNADYQLTRTFYQGVNPTRDDIDWVINSNRYIFPHERIDFCFPFVSQQSVSIKNRTEKATYDPYFYGFFKDLYINVNYFVNLVKDESIKSYVELYKKIFDDINKSGGNYWDFALVPNDNTSAMIIIDKRMLPSGNNKSTPWYFDYVDADQLMTNLSFKPKMSDAQAFRVVFGETNNSGSITVVKEENDLLNFQFQDRILSKSKNNPPTIQSDKNSTKNAFRQEVRIQQHYKPAEGSYQFTINVEDKPYIRRLVLPDADLLNCLLDDNDQERNQRYTGIQPITVEVGMQGIGGIRTFMSFLIRNIPDPYNHNDVCYRIVDVHHTLQDGKWDTVVRAGILPLRGYIKEKLGIPK